MATPYVCSTCRSRILRSSSTATRSISRAASRTQQAQARDGSENSFSGSRDQLANRSPGSTRVGGNGNGGARGRYSGRQLRPEQLLNQLGHPGESYRNGTKARHTRPESRSNGSVVNDGQREHKKVSRNARLSPEANSLADRFVVQIADEDFQGAAQTLQQFERECDGIVPSEARTIFTKPGMVPSLQVLLTKATRQWVDELAGKHHEKQLPTPLDIFKILNHLRATNPSLFRTFLRRGAIGISEIRIKRQGNDKHTVAIQNMIRQLVQMWRVAMAVRASFHQSPLTRSDSDSTPALSEDGTDWTFLPHPTTFDSWKSERRSHQEFEGMLNMLLPSARDANGQLQSRNYATAALVTLDLLRTVKIDETYLAQLPEHAPFVQILEAILKVTPAPRIPEDLLNELSTTRDRELLRGYEAIILRLGLHDTRPSRSIARSEAELEVKTDPSSADGVEAMGDDSSPETGDIEFAEKPLTPQIENFARKNVKRLGRAIESHDIYFTEKIKREVYALAGSHQHTPRAVPLELYEHLMLAFLSLRHPKAAMDVWNHIIQLGYVPTVKTYSVMMRGARISRDGNGMEALWQKMRAAGIQPDAHAWAIRIGALFGLNAEKQGFQALDDMTREFLTAAKAEASRNMTPAQAQQFAAKKDLVSELLSMYPEQVNGVPRPDVITMNSAISSLAHKREHMIADVLRWGRSLAIEPDVTTYNALLHVSMRKNQTAEAMGILQSMQKRGIEADSATWTVLLTALFEGGFLDGVDHLEQQKKILDFVDALENKTTGMPGLDQKGYALIIDRLMKYHANPTAANAVMARMIQRGVQPTCHMYTILMTHYFNQQPEPDIAAAQQLWNHIQSSNKGWGVPLDNIFFDRMVEGFARNHRAVGIELARRFRTRAKQAGQRTGWTALETLARAYAERNQWDQLRALYEEVQQEIRIDRVGTSGRGPNSFFSFINDTGILRGEGIYSVEQMLPAHPKEGPLVRAAATAAEGAWR